MKVILWLAILVLLGSVVVVFFNFEQPQYIAFDTLIEGPDRDPAQDITFMIVLFALPFVFGYLVYLHRVKLYAPKKKVKIK